MSDEYKEKRSAAWNKSSQRAIIENGGTVSVEAAFLTGYDTASVASYGAAYDTGYNDAYGAIQEAAQEKAAPTEEPALSFQAIVKECALVSGMRAGRDEEWSGLTINLWPNGDWNVVYMGKEYRIPMAENINKMLERINKASEGTK